MTVTPSGRARHRVAWGLLDQGVSSGLNFIATILAARALSPGDFGAFAVAIAVFFTSVALARGMASDVLASAHAGDAPEEFRWAVRTAGSTAVAVSLVPSAASVLASLVVAEPLGTTLLVLAAVMPGLVLQDYLRYALIVCGRAKHTFFNDLCRAVIQVPLLLLAIERGSQAPGLVLAWGLAGVLAAALGLVQMRTRLGGLAAPGRWLRRHRGVWPYYLLDNMILEATRIGLVLIVTITATLSEVGALHAALTVYAPLTVIGLGVIGVAIPELARRRNDPLSVRRQALTIAWLWMPVVGCYALLTQFVPDDVGRAFFGATWELSQPLLLLTAALTAVSLFVGGAGIGIRALSAGKEGLAARIVSTVLVLSCATVGSVLDGAHGVVAALALLAPVQMVMFWYLLTKAARNRCAGDKPASVPVPNA